MFLPTNEPKVKKKEFIGIRIDTETLGRLNRVSERTGLSVSEIIRNTLRAAMASETQIQNLLTNEEKNGQQPKN